MRRAHFEAFRPVCPVCAAGGAGLHPLRLADTPQADREIIRAAILHCSNPGCRHEYPVIDHIPIIVPDLARVLSERATALLLRDDLDPALASLLGDAIGPDSWFDQLRQVASTYGWDSYADLDPQERPEPDGPQPGAARRCLARLLGLAPPGPEVRRAVDLGCGAGRTSFELAARHPGALVLGMDLDIGLLRLAQAAARGRMAYPRRRIGLAYDYRQFPATLDGAGRVDFWCCDALALPFAPGAADLAAALNLLDCVPEPRRLLAALAEAVRPGGRALLATPYRLVQPRHRATRLGGGALAARRACRRRRGFPAHPADGGGAPGLGDRTDAAGRGPCLALAHPAARPQRGAVPHAPAGSGARRWLAPGSTERPPLWGTS